MTYRAQRPQDCDGHRAFPFRTDAERRARLMRDKGKKVRAFACAACGKWHIGNPAFSRKPGRPIPRVRQL